MRADEKQLRTWMLGGLDGNSADHSCLLHALVPILSAFYNRRMTASHDVEDLVQETLIAVHTRRSTYDRERPFTAWLFSVARYKMIDHFRRSRVTTPIDGLEQVLMVEGFESSSGARLDIDDLLETLPAKQARMIRATRIDGDSIAEAAAANGYGESDVKVSIHRGLKALSARIRGSDA
ncbi:MAG: sigma-70 family RNA polymerase sigma factor [Pseudomonadota bacterium]